MLLATEEEFSLDITNKEKPVLFFVDNLSRINNYSSSILSTIFEIVVNRMNYTGKADSIFCIDDFSDLSFSFENFIMINNRNHRISTYIAMQNLAQFETRYREGEQLRGKFENQFLGLGGCAIQKEQGTNMELLNLPNKRKKRFQFNLISIYINCNLKEKKHQETLPKDFQPEFYSVGEFSFKNHDLKDVIKFCSYDGGTAEIPEFFSVTEEDVNINYDRINREVKELLENIK